VLNLSPPLDFDVKWFANHPAYTLAKYSMSVYAWAMAEEFKGRIAFNGLWPRTGLATAAILNVLGGVTISQTAEARRRRIKALVYVCGLMPPSGKASREMTAGDPEILFRRSREVSPDGLTYTFARAQLPALFYQDVSYEDRYRAMERLRPQPISISTTPLTLTEDRYGSVPRWYIECTLDNAVRIGRQRAMVKTLPCKVITMECGHSPFYSNPDELVEHLEAIAAS
jgi:pimeloyl-ACP methyl ester carboxylesterase